MVSVCAGIGSVLTKSLLSAGAIVYALDNSQQSLDRLVSEVLFFLLIYCLSNAMHTIGQSIKSPEHPFVRA